MKTASRFRLFRLLPVTILGGLLATLVASMFLPALSVSPELSTLALSGLIIYSFGALAMVGRRRPRVVNSRAARFVLADAIITSPARSIATRVRNQRRESERLAA